MPRGKETSAHSLQIHRRTIAKLHSIISMITNAGIGCRYFFQSLIAPIESKASLISCSLEEEEEEEEEEDCSRGSL